MERAVTFIAVAALVVFYAARGGTYDLVLRQEAGLAIWWALAIGFGTGVLPRARPSRWLALPAGALAALIAWTALSHGWTESDERTTAELARTLHHAGILVLAASVLRRETWSAAVGGVLAGMGAVCVLAVASRLEPAWFPADSIAEVYDTNRLSYPLNYWNAIAAWTAVTVAMALPVSAHSRHPLARAAALSVVPVAVLAAYLTYSRGALLGMLVGVPLALVLSRHRLVLVVHALPAAGAGALAVAAARGEEAIAQATGTAGAGRVATMLALGALVCAAVAALTGMRDVDERVRVPRRFGLPAAGAAALAVAVVGAITLPAPLSEAWDEFRNERQATSTSTDPAARLTNLNGGRYEHYVTAWAAFESQPVKGIGAGSFEYFWNRRGDQAGFIRDAHSLYLETLAELGLIGAIALLALLAGLLIAVALALREARSASERGLWAACVAGFAVTLFHAGFEWIWESTANITVALLLAGAGAAALGAARERAPRRLLRAALTVMAVVAALVQLPGLVSTSKVRESQAAVLAGDEAAARAAVADAVETQPWAASPYVQRALLAERAGTLDAALRDVERAREREPTNWRHELLRARILAEQGRARAALDAFKAARDLRPRSGRFGS